MPITTVTPPQTDTISLLHSHIIESHILTRLDGQTLASASCATSTLHSMTENNSLWSNLCSSTWPSTSGELVSGIIDGFSNDRSGPRVFFAQSFPLPSPDPTTATTTSSSVSSSYNNNELANLTPSGLISAVDIYFRNKLIFTKVEETETVSSWFRCSPFRIDLLDSKDMVHTEIPHPDGDDKCTVLNDDIMLSWILIDPIAKRAVNLSSHKPVSVKRHWLGGEVQVRFASILAGGYHKYASDATTVVRCRIVMNCGRSELGEMQVTELSMEVEDMDGKHLNGRDSLVILQMTMEGKRGNGVNREIEAKNRDNKFEEMKRERRNKKLRLEGAVDWCVF